MGGKKKQAQRTKDNVRPSSSGRSAELLGNLQSTPFIGFSSTKDGNPILPGFSLLSEEGDAGIDTNFQMVLKKMNKKDGTTKLKALQEFSTLCSNSEAEAVTAILPYWPRMYSLLAVDIEHRVREASHIAHKAVISKVKRAIAPYFKHIAGVWFTSQYDTYAPAASAATLAFQEAFSPAKSVEALIFSQQEILKYIYDNLIIQTAQTLSNPKLISPEDMETKYERVVVSSLQGYSAYLSKLTSDQLQTCEADNKQIIHSSKFWKFSKHKSPIIRYSFFQVITSLCQNGKFLLAGESSHLVSAVFNQLDESDAMVLPVIWDTALHVLLTVDDCWSEGNVEKRLLPKLHIILKEGGKGNAKTIFPNLLPLISKIPVDIEDKLKFYNKFFESIRFGMDQKAVSQSLIEGKIVSTTFIECLKYVIMVNCTNPEFVNDLVTAHIAPVLEKNLYESNLTTKSTSAPLFSQIGSLLQCWSRNKDEYEAPLNTLWKHIYTLFKNSCTGEEHILKNQLELIFYFKDPEKYFERKSNKVKFADELENDQDHHLKETSCSDELLTFVKYYCLLLFEHIPKSKNFLSQLLVVMSQFNSKEILLEIANKKSTTLLDLQRRVIQHLDSDLSSLNLVTEFSFQVLRHIECKDEEGMVFDSILTLWDRAALDISKNVMKFKHESKIWDLFQQDTFTNLVVDLYKRTVDSDLNEDSTCDILKILYSATGKKGEFLLNPQLSSQVVDLITSHLNSSSKRCTKLLGEYLLTKLHGSYCTNSYESLLVALFEISLFEEISWENGVQELMCQMEFQTRLPELIKKLARVCHQRAVDADLDRIILNINHLMNCLTHGALTEQTVQNSDHELVLSIAKSFLNCLLVRLEQLERFCIFGDNFINVEGLISLLKGEHKTFRKTDDDLENLILETTAETVALNVSEENLNAVLQYYKSSTIDPTYVFSENESLVNFLKQNILSCKVLLMLTSRTKTEYHGVSDGKREIYQLKDVGENHFFSLYNYLWNTIYCLGILESYCRTFPYTELYKTLYLHTSLQKKLVKEIIENLSIIEAEFLKASCKYFCSVESNWKIITPTVFSLFNETKPPQTSLSTEQIADVMNVVEAANNETHISILSSLLTSCVLSAPWSITEKQWDFIFIQADNWINKFLNECMDSLEDNEEVLQQINTCSRLLHTLFQCFNENHLKPDDERIVPIICQSWNEVVRRDVWNKYFKLWIKIVDKFYGNTQFNPKMCKILERIGAIILFDLGLRENEGVSKSLELSKSCYTYILSRNISVQYTSFKILLSLVPDLIQLDTETFQNKMSETIQEEYSLYKYQAGCKWTCTNLLQVFTDTQIIVNTLLSDFKIGDHCIVEPFTDSYNYTHACLLLWCVILDMCAEAHTQLKYQYANWLKETDFSNNILRSLFKLMPHKIIQLIENKDNCIKLFDSFINMDSCAPVCSERIEQLSCFVYRMCLQRLPAIVRQWWSELDNKSSALVEKVTSTYVSPLLISNELRYVQDHDRNFDKMEIKVYPSAREVRGIYSVDDAKMEVIITLPINYPLGNVQVDSGSIIVSMAKWRNWLFRINMYLLHENSSIFQSLVICKNYLDKKFDGVEECYICYSILQGSNYELPRTTCRNCKKKFHMSCLYKWFSTSTKSTCPLCRNMF